MRCSPVKVEKDGWSSWQKPKMVGYKMQCCDCGLIHEVEFKVVKPGKKRNWGWSDLEEVTNGNEVMLRMRRT